MEDIKLVEKLVIVPEKPTSRRRFFLSNIDLSLDVYQDIVSFFDPPTNKMSFLEACNALYKAMSSMLVPYFFLAGRLVPATDDDDRLEIDCNDKGMIVATAMTEAELSSLGELLAPKPEFKKLIALTQQENEDQMDPKDKPLVYVQLTQFGCGSLALAARYNHCILDGIGIHEIESNWAALTRGDNLATVPNPDRTLFRARNPPQINHPHHEYSKAPRNKAAIFKKPISLNCPHLIHLSPQHIANLRKKVLKDGKPYKCSTFEVVAANIWKARSIAAGIEEESISTMLIPVDIRKRVIPQTPDGFAGNAVVPAFARATGREIKAADGCYELVKRVQEGIMRLNDEYVRSGIDWLEVNRGGGPCWEDSFSLVAWWKLGLEEEEFGWGKVKCATIIQVKPGLVILLPGTKDQGGLNVCIDLPDDHMEGFIRSVMEE